MPDASPPLPPSGILALNEIHCHDPNDEWIELINPGSEPVDTTGWTVAAANGTRPFLLPEKFTLAPGRRLVLTRQTAYDSGFTFDLTCGQGGVVLQRPDGTVADSVGPPEFQAAYTWGRLEDGAGEWQRTMATPGAANIAAYDPADPIYEPMHVVEIEINLEPTAIRSLDSMPYEYVPATFQIVSPPELATDVLDIGIRLKGVYGSFRTLDGKAAFRIDFDRVVEGQRLLGLEHMALNNYVQDPAMMHEIVAYRIFRELGLAAPRVGHAWVRVNGQDYGLYANVEAYDRVFLDKHFFSTAHLYEGQYGSDVQPFATLEVDEGDSDDISDLEALNNAVVAPDEDWLEAMSPIADLDQMVRVWATEIFIGHWDGYAPTINNFFLHSDRHGVFRMLPWGTDQTFDAFLGYMDGNGRLWARCRQIPSCRDAYGQALIELTELIGRLDLDTWITELETFLAPWVERDPRREYSAETVTIHIQRMRDFLARRLADASEWTACLRTDADGDGVTCSYDCDDENASVYPGAAETCSDGLDQDCNGSIDDAIGCPEDCQTRIIGNHRYLFCNAQRTWDNARQHCEALGTQLFVMNDWYEEDLLWETGHGEINCWLGITDQAVEGQWLTVTGDPVEFTLWAWDEPNNVGNEDCAERWSWGEWNDSTCHSLKSVVCEGPCTDMPMDADGDGVASVATCGTDCNDDDPSIYPGAEETCNGVDENCDGIIDGIIGCPDFTETVEVNGKQYLFSATPRTWADGRRHCQAFGADLLVLDSAEEESALINATPSYPSINCWLGNTDQAVEGEWRTVQGTPLPWTRWAPGEPNNVGDEDCAERWSWGEWNDSTCNSVKSVVCEMP